MMLYLGVNRLSCKSCFRVAVLFVFIILYSSCSNPAIVPDSDADPDIDTIGNNGSTGNDELFYSDYPYAFVSTSTNEPILLNGVNIIRAPHRNSSGVWQTSYINEEITTLGKSSAPRFNTIRIAMFWPIFQPTPDSMDEEAFHQLDILLDNAIHQNLYVILDINHLYSNKNCGEDPAMKGAQWNIPKWAWESVGAPNISDNNCVAGSDTRKLLIDVLAQQSTADYIKYILNRYDSSTRRGRQVIAIDLVNEPVATPANTAREEFEQLLPVYEDWLKPTGSKSLRGTNPDKILIVEPLHGNISLVGTDLSGLQQPNVVFSFHDYFGRATYDSPTYGLGYSDGGWSSKSERTDKGDPTPYDPSVLSYEKRLEEHTVYVKQWINWLSEYELPLFIGEYGIGNPCEGGNPEYSAQYAKDVFHVYENMYVVVNGEAKHLLLPRTWWSHGYWNGMALWNRKEPCFGTGKKEYFPYAYELTGELNLLENSGFEYGFDEWSTSGNFGLAVVTGKNPENIRSGINAAAAWNRNPYISTLQNASASNLDAGTYSAKVWSRSGGTFNQKLFRVYVNSRLANKLTIPTKNNWTMSSIDNISVPSGASIKIEIYLNAKGGGWAQFDDFELRKAHQNISTQTLH